MNHTIAVPHEIIDEIISHLTDDLPALHSCSVTSRSFYAASRKHIFSTIRVYSPSTARKLNTLLDKIPDITSLVTTLHVYVLPHKERTSLPAILLRLRHVTQLIIGHEGDIGIMHWRTLSPLIKGALETYIGSPTLNTLVLTSILHLPVSVLARAEHIKVLKLRSVAFAEPDASGGMEITSPTPIPAPSPMRLESIQFSSSTATLLQFSSPIYAPRLRTCTIVGNSVDNLLTIKKICSAVEPMCGIENIRWLECRGDYPDINTGILTCTRRLEIVTWTFNEYWAMRIPSMWASISKLMNDASISRLEEFRVTLRRTSDLALLRSIRDHHGGKNADIGNNESFLGAPRAWWVWIDEHLGDPIYAPKLRTVNFNLEIIGIGSGFMDSDSREFLLLVKKQLPLLRSRNTGMLAARLRCFRGYKLYNL
ncbi:hypothetical protein BDZ94DRAFT_1324665 [Collybia nuda]|uniref:F-box domain-containing protein n=1 Tax=Collybia nuda TaxID=64659 RepID=A0A9P5XYW5_9AGAR|nr:hypothetical protein BDZ94DRAFT_1324665 [Collybia nuda]